MNRAAHMHRRLVILAFLTLAVTPAMGEPANPPVQGKAVQANEAPLDGNAVDASRGSPAHSKLGSEPVRNSPGQTSAPGGSAPSASPGLDYARVMGALAIVIALIFALRWLGKFLFPAATGRGSNRAVEVLTRSAISPKQQVLLLRVGQRVVVVGDSGGQMNALCEITDSDEVAALVGQLREDRGQTPGRVFGAMFGRSRSDFDEANAAPARPSAQVSLREREDEAEPDDAPVASAREELSGLRERIRVLARQFNGQT